MTIQKVILVIHLKLKQKLFKKFARNHLIYNDSIILPFKINGGYFKIFAINLNFYSDFCVLWPSFKFTYYYKLNTNIFNIMICNINRLPIKLSENTRILQPVKSAF